MEDFYESKVRNLESELADTKLAIRNAEGSLDRILRSHVGTRESTDDMQEESETSPTSPNEMENTNGLDTLILVRVHVHMCVSSS
jgi:hypothetical protein